MREAGKIMSTEIITIGPDDSVLDAVRLLKDHEVTGLPVLDKDKNLCGIITEKDVLRLLVDSQSSPKRVSDYMTRNVASFKESSSIMDVCKFMMKKNFRRVPIVDDEGRLVGVVSRSDIMGEIMRLRDI